MKTYTFSFSSGQVVPFTESDFANALAKLGQWAVMSQLELPPDATIRVTVTDWTPPTPKEGP